MSWGIEDLLNKAVHLKASVGLALHGLEDILDSYVRKTLYEHTVKSGKWKGKVNRQYLKSKIYGFSRYADDFAITAKSKEDLENIIPVVTTFLKERGLELNQEKTQKVHIQDGFDFLGFHVRQFNGKCLVKPQKSKVLAKLKEIKAWLSKNKTVPAVKVIKHHYPIIRGWGNYYSKVNSKEVFSYFSHRLWKMLWQWSLRRHPKKGKNWVKQKYFCRHHGRDWTFHAITENRKGENQTITLFDVTKIPIKEHDKVQGINSPDDAELKGYWQKRNCNECKSIFQLGSIHRKVAERQLWKCKMCSEKLANGEELHLHHVTPIKNGGKDELSNYELMHYSCHKDVHKPNSLV